jgi:hypothetical protein
MKQPARRLVFVLLACAIASACAAKRPVLYPNEKYQSAGIEASQIDVDTCMRQAETGVGDKNVAASTAGRTAVGAAGGAAVGAVGGAISGHAGTGAAVGAGAGATAGLLSGLWGSNEHDSTYMAYVETCLREKGYQPIGWK